MTNKIKNILFGVAGVIVGLLFATMFLGGENVGGVYSNVTKDFSEGISVDGTVVIDGSGNIDAPITSTTGTFSSTLAVTGATTFNGLPTLNAGILHSYLNSTSTADTTQELSQADILNYSSVIMTPTVGATTLTFQASSTMPNLVPTAGDSFTQRWYNASTTAAITLTFAAGTGIDIEVSTSSTNALVINPDGFMDVTYFRKPATATTYDIGVLLTHFDNGD